MCGQMPTPKPGQIRCPTCHQPTPMAAFCTQCGAAIPAGAQARPRGMDRQELDAKIRQRRPGEGRLRRGASAGEHGPASTGYVPFEPAAEDAQAVRESGEPAARVDNTPADFDERPQPAPPPRHEAPDEPAYIQPENGEAYAPRGYEAAEPSEEQAYDAYRPDEPYGAPEDAYPYPDAAGEPQRGGPGMLPVLGFAALAILALGVGAALAGILGGGGIAATSPTPTISAAATPSVEPSVEATPSGGEGSATPEPKDGPVTFPDGAEITVQPCATQEMDFDGCAVDGSTISKSTMWVWIGFNDAVGSDVFTLELQSEGQTVNQQEMELGSLVGCPGTCSGYLIGAAYRDLDPGEYQLIVRRDDDFADSATFTVEG
jgi:hypothetical protein